MFEIPTFLLLTLVIYAIYIWKSIRLSKKFFPKKRKMPLILGISFVWSIWIIVTVVYAEVIIGSFESDPLKTFYENSFFHFYTDSSVTTECPGRASPSYDEMSSDIRTLTITYQSIMIVITAFLVGIFVFFTALLMQAATIKKTASYIMTVGGIISFSFFLRCILFVILLALDITSSVYLFITLFITEVLPMFLLLLMFNRIFLLHLYTLEQSRISSTFAK